MQEKLFPAQKTGEIKERAYQRNCVETLWKEIFNQNDMLVVLPTASGKTIIFTLLLDRLYSIAAKKGRDIKSMVLVNRVKLVDQTKEKLLMALDQAHIGLSCGSLGERESDKNITVGSIATVEKSTPWIDLLIIDEAHNAYNSSMYKSFIKRLREYNPSLKIIRFTATPFAPGGGYIYGPEEDVLSPVFEKPMMEMINDGYLVPPIFKCGREAFDTSKLRTRRGEFILKDIEKLTADKAKIRKQVADAIPRLTERKKIIWACSSIQHAKNLKAEIDKFEECAIIHSKLSKREKYLNVEDFERGSVRHMVSVTMVSEGYDFPAVDTIILMRPTRSPTLYVQLVGRGLRLSPNKSDCLVLDYGEVVDNLGHPANPILKDKRRPGETRVVVCPQCETFIFLPASACSQCGYELAKAEARKGSSVKNLGEKAKEYNFNEKGNREETFEVRTAIKNEDYVSKKGNNCIRIEYVTSEGKINDFLVKGQTKAMVFKELTHKKGRPSHIRAEKKGKYWEVRRMLWQDEERREFEEAGGEVSLFSRIHNQRGW